MPYVISSSQIDEFNGLGLHRTQSLFTVIGTTFPGHGAKPEYYACTEALVVSDERFSRIVAGIGFRLKLCTPWKYHACVRPSSADYDPPKLGMKARLYACY